jgi:phosphoglycerol transferase MdoB-like AlkP superfamily enzyme
MSFPFAAAIYRTLVPYNVQYGVMPSSDRIVHYLGTPRVSVTNVTHRKNLILWHIECAEQQSLGLFNDAHRNLMPHLSRLANSTTVLEGHIMNRGDWFTMASVFTQQSGLPLLGLSAWDRGSVFSSSLAHLMADYLAAAGYSCLASCTRYCSQIILYHRHKTRTVDATQHHAERDWPHWRYIGETLLPELASKEQPFYLIMHSEDTHPFFFVDPQCLAERPELASWPKSLAAFECTDLLIPRFMDRVKELGLDNNTEVVLYGDHLLWGSPQAYDHGPERRLLMVFASHGRSRIVKRTTWFDVAPTLLDLVGIKEYDPPFPYGENMFSDQNGTEPSDSDRVYIQNMVLAKG